MKTLMRTMTALMMVAVGVGFMGCKHSVTPDFTGPQYIEFGMWPQTKLADENIITDKISTEQYRGWDCYKGSDGAYYVKEKATQTRQGLKFDDGTNIVKDNDYYFKLEPIQWRVLAVNNGKKLLFAEKELDIKCCYGKKENRGSDSNIIYPNNYKESDIRSYLNNEFMNKAFTPAEIASISVTDVDNSIKSTIGSGQTGTENKYACENTSDKIFLLSLDEITRAEYGFSSYNKEQNQKTTFSRAKKTTDYTRAKDIWVYNKADHECYINYTGYWLRSPRVPLESDFNKKPELNIVSDLQVQMIGEDGRNGHEDCDAAFGIVPALVL